LSFRRGSAAHWLKLSPTSSGYRTGRSCSRTSPAGSVISQENQLRSRPRDDEALKDEEIKRLKQKVGELVLDNDILREAAKPYRPTEGRTSDE
jgi:hypothetical protein